MAGQLLLNILVCVVIILLTRNVKSEDNCPWLRPKYGVGVDTDKCQFENITTEQGTFSCIEKCDQTSEVRKTNT